MTTESQNRPLRVFLCHAREDKPAVWQLFKFLCKNGIDAWLDEEKILPGQDWNAEIRKALRASDAILVCLSQKSITKEGYVQKEIKVALDIADEKPEDTIFFIPARLDECTIPERIGRWQWVDLFGEASGEKLIRSLTTRAESLGLTVPRVPLPDAKLKSQGGIPAGSASVKKPVSQVVSINQPVVDSVHITWADIEFVRVPAGEFIMGSKLANEYSSDDEAPLHTVNIPYDYWIGRFPITHTQFSEFIGWTHYFFEWVDDWKKKLDHPVAKVSWDVTQVYLKWLNETHAKDIPMGLVFRLPTEAEWEKAARGLDGREWPWGNEFIKGKCNFKQGGKGGTTPAGAYSPMGDSPFGAADMAGNVWEWTQSIYKPYPYDPKDGRENLKSNDARVARGGSFSSEVRSVRCASRYKDIQYIAYERMGFRVVVAPLSP